MSMIYKIAENLQHTITGKEQMLVVYLAQKEVGGLSAGDMMAITATIEFLKININELKVILFDVKKACEEHSLMSWEINPERMGQ